MEDAQGLDRVRKVMARVQPPDNELPAVIPLMVSLGRTGAAAVQLTCVEVYSSALMVHVDVRTRAGHRQPVMGPVEAVDGGLLTPNGDHRLSLVAEDGVITDSWTNRYPRHGAPPGSDQSMPTDTESTVYVAGHGGGSADRGYQRRLSYWLTPRPIGSLVLGFEWTALGIGPSRTPLSADELRRASAHITTLWSQDSTDSPDK